MTRFFSRALFGCFALVLLGGTVFAGPIVVSGDGNITDALFGTTNGVPGVDAGNQTFFQNVLGGGTTVAVQGPGAAVPFIGVFTTNTNNYYNGLGGVSSSIVAGPITAATLSGVDLFVSILPSSAYAASEIAAMSGFLGGGGTIFFLGENSNFSGQNANINAALAALGSGISLNNTVFDGGFHVAAGAQIAADPLTAGVTTFTYAAPTQLTGGTTLFFGTGGQPFVAVDALSAPEPGALVLFGFALWAVAGRKRRRRAG